MLNTENLNTLETKEILDFYHSRCLINPAHKAVCVHEIYPRSQRPKNWMEFENRVALCSECHDTIHRNGNGKEVKSLLARLRKEWIEKYVG